MRFPAAPPADWVWLFDLDNTLYPAASNLFDQVDRRITDFIAQALNLPFDAARTLQKDYYREFGTSLRGLMLRHQIEAARYLEYVHDIDVSVVPENPRLDAVLARLPGRKLIYTNGSARHAQNVCRRIGIWDRFEAVYDIAAAEFEPKPALAPYQRLLQQYAIDPAATIMVEDIARNLEPAAQLGMTTVLVLSPLDAFHHDPAAVHHRVEDLTPWLDDLANRLAGTPSPGIAS